MPYPIRYLIVLFALIATNDQLQAQDPFFSQFYANRVYLNPAYAGLDGGTQLTLNYRDQWFGIPDGASTPLQGGYRTMNATLNQRVPCFLDSEIFSLGFAGSFFKDATGNAPLITTGFALAGSGELAIKPPNVGKIEIFNIPFTQLDIRAGFQFGTMQSSINTNNAIFSYQLDPVVGLGTDGRPLSLSLSSKAYTSLNVGIMVRGQIKHGLNSNTTITLGVSQSNINEPEFSLLEGVAVDKIYARRTIHAGAAVKVVSRKGTRHYNPIYLAPQFRWDRQLEGQLNLYTLGSYMLGRGFYTGIFYQFNTPNQGAANNGDRIGGRNTNALILNWGLDFATLTDVGERWHKRRSGWIVGFSYDLPISNANSSASLDSLEINCRILIHKLKKTKCPILRRSELYKGATCPVNF